MDASLPSVFLLYALVSLAFTVNVHRPLRDNRVTALLSFLAGWLTSELALHHLAFQVVVALLFLDAGAASSPAGKVALVPLALSWAGLLVAWRQAGASRERVLAGLREVLGPDYEEQLLPPLAPLSAPPLTASERLYPFRIHRPGVEVLRDRVYHQEGRLRLRLDLYQSPSVPSPIAGAPRPMLLYIHGGAWILGDKERQGLPLLNHLASRGWLCATASYRLSPRATFPDHLVDVKRAIAWLRAHAPELGGDPGFLLVAGGSAGGHLAALAALTAGDPSAQPGFESADTSVAGCIGLYGVYDFLDREGHHPHGGLRRVLSHYVMKSSPSEAIEDWERASPLYRVHAGAPPFLLLHGTHDTLVPVETARRFAEALREAEVSPTVLLEFPGGQHAFEVFPSLRAAIGVEAIDRFASWLYSTAPRARSADPPPRVANG